VLRAKLLAVFLFIAAGTIFSNGLMMPTNAGYPKDFLKNTVTKVDVNIFGLIAETIVYQEFVNEWDDSTDVVYSFPLPPEARATLFNYQFKGQWYTAVLKITEQATNPGTGEGGIAAYVNSYIGRNGIKVHLKGVQRRAVQKVELRYISILDYHKGINTYKFPLNTEDFVKYPLDHLEFNFNVTSNSEILSHGLISHDGYNVISSFEKSITAEFIASKSYLNKDLEFFFETKHQQLGVDFYSVAGDSADGHFALFVRPQKSALQEEVFPRQVIFLLSNSGSMFGNKLNQSINAIKYSLDQLTSIDKFNIVVFNSSVKLWQSAPVYADSANIQAAKTHLSTININSGNALQTALNQCLTQIKDDSFSNSILLFTDGRAALNPRDIESINTFNTGIFPIGIGADLDRAKLEMTASLNYGFVTYVDYDENIGEKMKRVFDQINSPLMKQIAMEYGRADLTNLIPSKTPSIYAGSMFYLVGRYKNPGLSSLAIAGMSNSGMKAYSFQLNFNSNIGQYKFVESIWAKMKIDALEWEVEIYGESPELKAELIALSLKYNIRCRYTAYIADYEEDVIGTATEERDLVAADYSYLFSNYPNPFNPSTTFRIFINESDFGKTKLLRIFNILGQLIAIIDISHLKSGWHDIQFNGKDLYGNSLTSGIYFTQLIIGSKVANTLRINLIK